MIMQHFLQTIMEMTLLKQILGQNKVILQQATTLRRLPCCRCRCFDALLFALLRHLPCTSSSTKFLEDVKSHLPKLVDLLQDLNNAFDGGALGGYNDLIRKVEASEHCLLWTDDVDKMFVKVLAAATTHTDMSEPDDWIQVLQSNRTAVVYDRMWHATRQAWVQHNWRKARNCLRLMNAMPPNRRARHTARGHQWSKQVLRWSCGLLRMILRYPLLLRRILAICVRFYKAATGKYTTVCTKPTTAVPAAALQPSTAPAELTVEAVELPAFPVGHTASPIVPWTCAEIVKVTMMPDCLGE